MHRVALAVLPFALTAAVAAAIGCQSADPPPPSPNPPQLGEAGVCSNVPTCNGPNLPPGCVYGAARCTDGVNACGPVICPDAGDDGGPGDAASPVDAGARDAGVSSGCDAGGDSGTNGCNTP